MTNHDYVQAAIDLFEDSLAAASPLAGAETLAARVGYSSHHLNRLFVALCGETLGRYMQRRRLAAAATDIALGGFSAAEAAARFGWSEYSAFSRACRKEFGLSPGALRDSGTVPEGAAVRARPRLADTAASLAEPELVCEPARHVSGLVFHMGPNEKTFHRPWALWAQAAGAIRSRRGSATYQYSAWVDRPDCRLPGLWIHCAVETDPGEVQEPVFFSRTMPATNALRFVHEGPVETLYATYRAIWEDWLPRSTWKPAGDWEYQAYAHGCPVAILLPVCPS